jgi:hypothetical protein
MKKMKSLESFRTSEILELEARQLRGGAWTRTGGGSVCISKTQSASGCMSYDWDARFDNGTTGWHSTGDVNLEC